MAKQNKDDKGKVRVFLFELEGTNDTLLESIRSITGVLTQTFGAAPKTIVRMIPAQGDTVDGKIEQIEIDSEEAESSEKENSTASKPKRRAISTPDIIELDLNSGSISLKDFIDSKKPTEQMKKYLAIASWLKNELQIEEIDNSHIYTCYRFLGWVAPKDIGQTFRDGKRVGYFNSGTAKGGYKINHVGEGRVQDMN
jgi:hypothetical protein